MRKTINVYIFLTMSEESQIVQFEENDRVQRGDKILAVFKNNGWQPWTF